MMFLKIFCLFLLPSSCSSFSIYFTTLQEEGVTNCYGKNSSREQRDFLRHISTKRDRAAFKAIAGQAIADFIPPGSRVADIEVVLDIMLIYISFIWLKKGP